MDARLFLSLDLHESFFQWSCCHIFNNPLVILLNVVRVHLTQSFSWERRFSGCQSYFSFCVTSTFRGVLCVQQSCVKGAPSRQSLSFKKESHSFRLWCIGKVSNHCSQTSNPTPRLKREAFWRPPCALAISVLQKSAEYRLNACKN